MTLNPQAPAATGQSNSGLPARGLLRFLTCGSVDDGKSTLIGRLLYESGSIHDDQLQSVAADSKKYGTTGDEIDFALLVDGLEAEREQRITIDVAYRYFATHRRSFIVADAPGHEQYTRNAATGVSHSDLAILLVDARKGLLPQTFRHSVICDLFGIRNILLAVNKIDLVDFDRTIFEQIVSTYAKFAERLHFTNVVPIPLSARFGDNIVRRGDGLDWYSGPTLLEHLETVEIAADLKEKPFRMPVQWINRPTQDFRGVCGTISSGSLQPGDAVIVANSGRTTRVKRITSFDGDQQKAAAGEAVTLVLDDEIDVSRGDVLSKPDDRPEVSNQFTANLIWMDESPLFPGRVYLARIGNRFTPAVISNLKHQIDIANLQELASKTLGLNEIGVCNLETTIPVAFDPYQKNRETGSLILIDRETNATVAAGMILHGLRRAQNVHHQRFTIGKAERSAAKLQKPCILWFTGLSGSGKSTIANLVEQELHGRGCHTMSLDGDNFRNGLNRDLGFTQVDRIENIRRSGEVAKLMVEAGLIVLCSFISPFAAERALVRSLVAPDEFIEIFVDTPIDVCIQRDPKGLYKKALAGAIPNFTGISAPYEIPAGADIILKTANFDPADSAQQLIAFLEKRQIVKGR